MSYEEACKLMEEYGWNVDCWSPFELSKGESRATLEAAEILLWCAQNGHLEKDDV